MTVNRMMYVKKLAKIHHALLLIATFLVVIPHVNGDSTPPKQTDIVFVLFDAGETNAMKPVISQLQHDAYDVLVITMATSATLGVEKLVDNNKTINIGDLLPVTVDKQWDRYKALTAEQVAFITETIKPKVVVSGVASAIQKQLVGAWGTDEKVTTMAYFDNFGAVDNISYASIVKEIEKVADIFMVPSAYVASTSQSANAIVVGQPSLESWIDTVANINTQAIYKQAGLDSNRPVVTFISGYDDGIDKILTNFIQAMKTQPEYQVIIRPHPRTDASLELRIITDEACKQCHLSTTDMNTQEAVSISDVIVCHKSTVGIQALFVGKKIIYLDLPDTTFSNPDIAFWKLSRQVFNQTDFLAELLENHQKKPKTTAQLFDIAGIPQQASNRIADLIAARLASSEKANSLPTIREQN